MQEHYPSKFLSFASIILVAFLIASQIYLIPKVFYVDGGLDFRLIWLAGQIWNDGISPYSREFLPYYETAFGEGPISHFWVYPPYWSMISRPLALLPFETALLIWNTLNYTLLVTAAFVFARLPLQLSVSISAFSRFAVALVLLSFAQATPFALALGQTSFLILGGVAVLLLAVRSESRVLVAVGTALIMLKPNFGLFIIVFIATQRFTWAPLFLVAVVYIAASLLLVSEAGLLQNLNGFIDNLARYDAPYISAGQPQNLTGIVHLADFIGVTFPVLAAYCLAFVIAIVVAIAVRNRFLGLAILSMNCFFLVPLHTYDMTLSLLIILTLVFQREIDRVGVILGVIAIMLLLRPDNVGNIIGIKHPDSMNVFAGSFLASIGLMLGCLIALLKGASAARS